MLEIRVEFHCHSIYSKDSLAKPEDLVRVAKLRGLDRLVITDHNSIGGALEAKALDPELIIVGEEIMTTRGELLAAFVREEIPKGLEPMKAIAALREQGAFISVSHPFDKHRNGAWDEDDLMAILPYVDAIETFNSRCMRSSFNDQAKAFALTHNLAGTVGSDAHCLREVGRSTLLMPAFTNADELKNDIRQAHAIESLSSPFIHLASRWAVLAKKSGLAEKR